MTAEGKKLRVGEALVAAGVLSKEQLATALEGQRSTGLRLGELLVAEGVISNAILVLVSSRSKSIIKSICPLSRLSIASTTFLATLFDKEGSSRKC